MTPVTAHIATWTIAALATAGVIIRPFKLPEALWAVAGATLLVLLGLLPYQSAIAAIGKGNDVYLFLLGMMLLSETARREGVFDWVAALAVNAACGSAKRLFLTVYAVGTVVTVFLSNDATAVVLTPAVFAAATKARIEPLPFLFICAFIANGASFVLPISNPANLVLYGGHTPALADWLLRFSLPSLLSIAATFLALRWAERDRLDAACAMHVDRPALSPAGWMALAGIGLAAIVLLTFSALDIALGMPTAILGLVTTLTVLAGRHASPRPIVNEISWTILPLVAGLFVLVEALDRTGLIRLLATALHGATMVSEHATAAGVGGLIAIASNLMNNLPAGLIASSTIAQAHAPLPVTDALLIGVDLGPNLSIKGSLATILWLLAIRREGETVSFWRFLRIGIVVMPPALILALGARLVLAAWL